MIQDSEDNGTSRLRRPQLGTLPQVLPDEGPNGSSMRHPDGSGGINQEVPNPIDPQGRLGETPRERLPVPPRGGEEPWKAYSGDPSGGGEQAHGAQGTPDMPDQPSPVAGSTFTAPSGLTPFNPMSSPDVGSMATPKLRGLFGSSGGLTGGGLGVPLDPQSNQASDPISTLIKLLSGGGGGY